MGIFVRDKSFYSTLIKMSIPIALQSLIVFAVNTTDTVLLGKVGELQLSACSLANQVFFIFTLVIGGISGGVTVLASQYWGKKDINSIKKIFSLAIKITFIFSFIVGITVLLLPSQIMSLYTNDLNVINEGVEYLKIMGFTYFVFGLSNAYMSMIRSVEIVRISVATNLLAFIINAFLDWVLIFGKFGIPAMGIKGAAIATLTARVIEFIIIFIFAFVIDKKINLKIRDILRMDMTFLPDLIKYGGPVVFNEIIWAVGISVQSAIWGRISMEAVAASSITNIVQQLSIIITLGIGNATAIVIGKTIGEGGIQKTKEQARTIKYLGYLLGLFSFGLIMLSKGLMIDFYNVGQETKEMADQMMIVCAIISFFVAINCVCMLGVFRGAGDTKFALKADSISLWAAALPLSAVAGLVLKTPVPLVFLFMKADEFIKYVLCNIRMRSDRWINDVTRDFD